MSNQWTSDQQKAMNATNGTILVSAAAGSGKTSVLVQRVINQITDPTNPTNIDKFLIVTFTKAAAKEMQTRIANKLSEMIAQNPGNSNLYRQQMMLKYAPIGTIHSFCSSIVKENFFRLGISPKFRIADESELKLIKNKAMESTLDYFYELKNPEFKAIVDLFGNEKSDDKLAEIIGRIYDFTRSISFPKKWLDEKLAMYQTDNLSIANTPWGGIILEHTYEILSAAEELTIESLETVNAIESFKKAYGNALEDDLEKIKTLKECFDSNNWDEIRSQINSFSFAKFKPLRDKNNESEKVIVTSKRDYIKDEFKKLKEYFSFTQEESQESVQALYGITKTLFEVTKHFGEEVYSLKLMKNIADFSDLEHWTLELLTDQTENGHQKSSIAEEISQRYKGVMVDEYQDINEIQNTIFKMITKSESNIFMVGDVKQSIYKFRRSSPRIFIGKKNSFSLYDADKDIYPAKIILGQNFRSKESIINSVNFIFSCLMSEKIGEIEYTDEEALVPGATYPESSEPDVSLKIIQIPETIESNDEEDESEDKNIIEAQNIAETIIKMIAQGYTVTENGKERLATYSDFCILLRSANSYAYIYAGELYKCGIPSWSETNEKFLGTKEISTIISILKIINNPVQDVPLISAMMSPIFGFTIDELSKIRQTEKDAPFYFALKKYAEDTNEKTTEFLETINRYRQIAGTMPCDELIEHIYYDTDYPAMCAAMPKGETKKANLALLVDYARNFENQYHKGLSGFLNFLENIKRKNSDLTPASISDETENTVKIMSIHKSKGLEFSVCIVAGCSRKFNFDKDSFVIHPQLGVGMKLKDHSGIIQYDNFIRRSIALKNKKEDISEELRILYVALTRAKQKLIMIASLKDPQKSVQKSLISAGNKKSISPQTVSSANSFADWIFLCLAKSNLKNKLCTLVGIPEQISDTEGTNLDWNIELIAKTEREVILQEAEEYEENASEANEFEKISGGVNAQESNNQPKLFNNELFDKIKTRFDFEYPWKDFINLPLKISASQLAKSGEWEQYVAVSRPSFMSSQSLTPTDRGAAMHKFMCCADFKNLAQNGIYPELNTLIQKGFLNNNEAKVLSITALEKFVKSDLFERISNSSKLLREHRFSVKIPPSMINESLSNSESENFIVTQGAIDCAFLENGEYIIVDYKTDKAANISELFDKYSKQLEIYKYALEHAQGIKVKELIIYSFYLNDQYIGR